jgi:hypothetical protein
MLRKPEYYATKKTATYIVTVRYNGTSKQYVFESRKEALDFMYKQELKGCDPRNMFIHHFDL